MALCPGMKAHQAMSMTTSGQWLITKPGRGSLALTPCPLSHATMLPATRTVTDDLSDCSICAQFTSELRFVHNFGEPFITYRVLDDFGNVIDPSQAPQIEKEEAMRIFKTMVRLRTMDDVLFSAQRQGRVSFYMTNSGEEASQVGSAAALTLDDVIFSQYREAGVLLWRGFTFQEACDQCVGNGRDLGKARQMPVHYGSKRLNVQTIASPLGTRMPQAAGAAYALKRQGKDACVVCYFGDGAASEGDFHGALNFASTLECPVIFFCRNNGGTLPNSVLLRYVQLAE